MCGVPRDQFLAVAEALCENSGRERTSAFCYAVGWTQHTVGVQYIRAAAIIQLLLGNIGRPGGGILALRGHASIQGSTDIPTLYNILPGYIPMPHAQAHDDLDAVHRAQQRAERLLGSTWTPTRSACSRRGGAPNATAENDFCFDYLPRITGDHSIYQTVLGMLDQHREGLDRGRARTRRSAPPTRACTARRWPSSTGWSCATWSRSRRRRSGTTRRRCERGELRTEDIGTEVFFLPAAPHTRRRTARSRTPSGCCSGTTRRSSRRATAARSCGSTTTWVGSSARSWPARRTSATGRCSSCSGTTRRPGEIAEPSAEAVLREINGTGPGRRGALGLHRAEGRRQSTACGCWIYCGCFADETNQPARRKPGSEQSWVAPEWGWAWPANRRILYNRASADPDGQAVVGAQALRLVGRARRARGRARTCPTSSRTSGPTTSRPTAPRRRTRSRGNHPFIMQADGRGWLFAPAGLVDGPMPTHYEPHESPYREPALRAAARTPPGRSSSGPATARSRSDGEPGADRYPYVMTTYRLTEHHTAGGMSRFVPYLSELQPEMFCEVSPELAAERGLVHGGWATIATERAAIEARVLVTERHAPAARAGPVRCTRSGCRTTGARAGSPRGDSANDLFPIVLDPNVHIQEVKAATCDIRPGRAPRGAIA